MSLHIGITPDELYHLYRFDEPTRKTQDDIRLGLFLGVPTQKSIPTIEQTMWPTHSPANRAERRRRKHHH